MPDNATVSSFADLPLRPELLDNLGTLGYSTPTPIQADALPPILDGHDVIGLANTGAGKTAAFGLGLLHQLDVSRFDPQALVLCPTRELADQVAAELRLLARGIANTKVLTLCGGAPIGPQIGSLAHGAHVLVGTPGRVNAHLRKQTLRTDAIKILVLDEADRMLDMGFEEQIETIANQLPQPRQTLMFSATFANDVERIAKHYLRQPVRVEAIATAAQPKIEQVFHRIDSERQRIEALERVLLARQPRTAIVFCATKQSCAETAQALTSHGFDVQAIHGDLDQRGRDLALARLSNQSIRVLIATDVAARGLDVSGLDLVVNFEPSRDAETHTHRIGRTGRLSTDSEKTGGAGLAVTLFTEAEAYRLAMLESSGDPILDAAPLPRVPEGANALAAPMATIQIDAGRKQKIRPGDVLGTLTSSKVLAGTQVGKIQVLPMSTYVAVARDAVKPALQALNEGTLKGRRCRARLMR